MAFPSTITAFTYPQASDRLNNPSHSTLENNQSSTIGQIQAVIGLDGDSSVLGTIIGDLRSPNSKGGGHVQGTAFGGTGQTTFTKGDFLVATSASVLTKLGVSATSGDLLTVDPTQAAGIKWLTPTGTRLNVSNSVVSITRGAGSVANVLFAASIVGSALGTANAIKFTGIFPKFNMDASESFTVLVNYGVGSVVTAVMTTGGGGGSIVSSGGLLEGMIVNNNAVTSQLGYVNLKVGTNDTKVTAAVQPFMFGSGTSSVESSATQNLIITGQFAGTATQNSILTGLFVVQKIG